MKRIIFVLCMIAGFSASSISSMNRGEERRYAFGMPDDQRRYDRWGYLDRNGAYDMWGHHVGPLILRHQCPVCQEENLEIAQDPENGVIHVPNCWNHWIHQDCLEGVVDQALNDREPGRLRCPVRNCGNIMRHENLLPALANNAELLARYNRVLEQQRIQQQIANDPVNGRHCPTADCEHAYLYRGVPQAMDCPECHQNYCANCLAQHPLGAQCQARENAAEVIQGLRNVKACPRCQRGIEKNDGCNHMTCHRGPGGCGHEFCWLCLQNYYDHNNDRCRRIQNGEEPQVNQPAPQVNPRAPQVNPRAPQVNPPIRRNYSLLYILGGFAVIGAGVAAYKLYKYLSVPKELPIKNLEVSFADLLKEATRCKQLAQNGFYIKDSLKNYFANEEKNKAFASLDATKLAALKKLVDDLEQAFVAGYCEREYLALINFKIESVANKDVAISQKLDAVQASAATQPPVKKTSVPAKASVTKAAPKRTNRHMRQVRQGK